MLRSQPDKHLKGFLAWRSLEIPRTHDLEELQRLCAQLDPWPELTSFDLTDLTAYAVELRYDAEFWPPQPTAADAVELAQQVRACVLARVSPDARP
jgi:HEPN domain-containing protein